MSPKIDHIQLTATDLDRTEGVFPMDWISVDTFLGPLCLMAEGETLTGLHLPGYPAPDISQKETPLLCRARDQLLEYCAGQRRDFDLPLSPRGTDFQTAVWSALRAIPYGETRTYGQIAAAIGRPKAVRAVGQANHCNPIAILIPCHRVVGANGSLTGYAGGLDLKKTLLDLERSALC